MNAKSQQQQPKPFYRKPVLLIAGVGVLAVGLWVYSQVFADPAPTWRVRWQISSHLKKQSGKSDFSVAFQFPSKKEMATAPTIATDADAGPSLGVRTRKDFETLRNEYMVLEQEVLILERQIALQQQEWQMRRARLASESQPAQTAPATPETNNAAPPSSPVPPADDSQAAFDQERAARQQSLASKREVLSPIVEDLWDFQREWIAELNSATASDASELGRERSRFVEALRPQFEGVNSYGKVYALIGQEIWVARRLFGSANPQHRRVALSLIRQAAQDGIRYAEDWWLAARLCEAYVWPHLDAAEQSNRRSPFTVENLLNQSADIFRQAGESQNIIRTYEVLLTLEGPPQRADWARVQLSRTYEQSGDLTKAVRYLKEIQATNDFDWALRRLSTLEQRAKSQ